MAAAEHDLDHWSYDALEPWSCAEQPWLAALQRSAHILWIEWDGNPAVAANMVRAVQRVEDFLADGAPPDVPASCAAKVRAHLFAIRRPGRSTRVEVAVHLEGPQDRVLISAELYEQGASRAVPLPGPSYAGLYGEPGPGRRDHTMRVLVAEGSSAVALELTITGPGLVGGFRNHLAREAVSLEVSAVQGECVRVEYVVDASDWPTLRAHRDR